MKTYFDQLEHGVDAVAYAAIGGSPWTEETKRSLAALHVVVADTIRADPVLREIFEKPLLFLFEDIDDDQSEAF